MASTNKDMLTSNDMSLYLLKFIKSKKIISHNHNSFNDFLDKNGLKNIICNIFKIHDTIIFDETQKHYYKGVELTKMMYTLRFTDVKFEKPKYVNPTTNENEMLTPNIARLKNLTYASDIIIESEVDTEYYYKDGGVEKNTVAIKHLYIGKYPIMVKSDMCHLNNATKGELINIYKEDPNDNGGYFIIGGVEWTIDTSESILYNSFRVYNNQYNNELTRGEFISKPGDGFEISREIIMRLNNNDLITIQLVGSHDIYEEYQIPFYLIFRLYGVLSDIDIFLYILLDFENDSYYDKIKHYIVTSMTNADKSTRFEKLINIYDHKTLLIEFGKIIFKNKKLDDITLIQSVYTLLDKSLLLHIGDDSSNMTRKRKLVYFGLLIRKLILVNTDILPVTDRDSYSTKRLHSAGISYAKTFKTTFRLTVVNGIKKQMKNIFTQTNEKKNINLTNLLNSKITGYEKLAEAVEKSIKTGNKEIVYDKANKPIANRISSQMLIRKNELNTLATLRVIHTQNTSSSNQTARAIEMRSVHSTYAGYICPTATADTGEKVGLSKQLAISAIITVASDSEFIKKKILSKIINLDKIINDNSLELLKKHTHVYVNGDLQGCVKDTYAFLKDVRRMRLLKEIDKYTTIHFNMLFDEIQIWVDYGRITRPLIKVYNNINDVCDKKNKFKQYTKLTKDHITKLNNDEINITNLEDEHIIEYISSEEQENCYLAYNIDEFYSNQDNILKQYTHIDIEEALFGITALTSPFLNHTMSQRGSYQTNQAKQSCGWFTLNPYDRFDKKKFYQTYCETPIIKTITSSLTYPNGVNLMVAMMCYTGYGQEDSCILNKSLIDNGYMAGYHYSYTSVKISDHNLEFIRLIKPTDNIHKTGADYTFLDENGVIKKGSIIGKNTVLISKLVLVNKKENKYSDKSEIYTSYETVIIDDIETSYYNPQENKIELVKIRTKSYRKILEGDKLSTRSGNKNIVSAIMNPADMPYTLNGEIPDMIVNPQGIPTRMCVGQLLESIFAKLAINKAQFIDGTAFTKFNVNNIKNELETMGLNSCGIEKMICGKTGHIINAFVFYTPLYIQHIMKFALEEMYVINHNGGPVDEVTHQPREGKTNNGGLKLGEMEKDVIASHGSTNVIQEKFINSSDFVQLYFCRNCGSKAIYNHEYKLKICKLCDFDADIVKVNSTHVTNVFQSYLLMLGIDQRYLFR
jgi:DNA-directed RNA polymerase II subunit RPB2